MNKIFYINNGSEISDFIIFSVLSNTSINLKKRISKIYYMLVLIGTFAAISGILFFTLLQQNYHRKSTLFKTFIREVVQKQTFTKNQC